VRSLKKKGLRPRPTPGQWEPGSRSKKKAATSLPAESRGRAIRRSTGKGRVELPRLSVSYTYPAHAPSPVQWDWPSLHNPQTFRRRFPCLLRKAGVDSTKITGLGRWERLEMVQRHAKSVTSEDSLKFYEGLVGW